jgi:hypothetical protein
MATWFIDDDETYWRLSKFAGGIQAEDQETGNWGKAIELKTAVEQFGVVQLPAEIGLVLDQFDKVKVERMSQNDFRTLRQSVVEVVKYIREQKLVPKVIEGKPEVNDVKGE